MSYRDIIVQNHTRHPFLLWCRGPKNRCNEKRKQHSTSVGGYGKAKPVLTALWKFCQPQNIMQRALTLYFPLFSCTFFTQFWCSPTIWAAGACWTDLCTEILSAWNNWVVNVSKEFQRGSVVLAWFCYSKTLIAVHVPPCKRQPQMAVASLCHHSLTPTGTHRANTQPVVYEHPPIHPQESTAAFALLLLDFLSGEACANVL